MTGSTGVAFSLPSGAVLGQISGRDASFDDYRCLVCVFLYGGNDSFNMLVPCSSAEYGVYAASRQNLAVPRESLLPVFPVSEDSEYGVHPGMPALQRLFEAERAAFVVNVGPLIAPATKEEYLDHAVALPPQLFSHIDQQAQWHSLAALNESRTGWAGRIADLMKTALGGQQLTRNVSLSGATLFQAGTETQAFTMGSGGPARFVGFSGSEQALHRKRAFQRLVSQDYQSAYLRAYSDIHRRAVEAADALSDAFAKAPPLSVEFPDSDLGHQLRTAAKLIAIRDRLEVKRQVLFTAMGGFDTHDHQLDVQPKLLSDLSEALGAFYAATVELGVEDRVVLFTQSDFGRTLTSNGDGTDHGWGGIQIAIGGSVRGRRLYGHYPSLELGGPDDIGRGRMIPSISTDQYAATLARWFGVPDHDLSLIAPHLENFSRRDLGFFV